MYQDLPLVIDTSSLEEAAIAGNPKLQLLQEEDQSWVQTNIKIQEWSTHLVAWGPLLYLVYLLGRGRSCIFSVMIQE